MLTVNAPYPTSAGLVISTAFLASHFSGGLTESYPSHEVDSGYASHSPAYHLMRHASSSVHANIRDGGEIAITEFATNKLVSSAQNAFSDLTLRQKVLGEEYQRVLSDNLWDLYEE